MCLGLFCTIRSEQAEKMDWKPETMDTAHNAETGRQTGAKLVLLACVIGSKIHGDRITADAVAPFVGSTMDPGTPDIQGLYDRYRKGTFTRLSSLTDSAL